MNTSKRDELLNQIYDAPCPAPAQLEEVLSWDDPQDLEALFDFADRVRKEHCGGGVFLRGIVEFSNFCDKPCFYCGISRHNRKLKRYRMSQEELFRSVAYLASCKIKTVVLQSGEDPAMDPQMLAGMIRRIKAEFGLAVTLCVGERGDKDYALWKEAGADRYLLKIETTNKELYEKMHPQMSFDNRLRCLDVLRQLGYQVGTGNIVGLPGQSCRDLAGDILFFKRGNFDMAGIGPFIPHKETPFSGRDKARALDTLKVVALTRIVTRKTHLPATTALGSLEQDYRSQGLKSGANVLMPNFTPAPWRKLYEIYPDKKCVNEPVGACNFCLESMAAGIGRFIDYGQGDSLIKKGEALNV